VKQSKYLIGGLVALVVLVVGLLIFAFSQDKGLPVRLGEEKPNESMVQMVADNLVTPWSIAFLPGGDMLVTERSGQVKRIGEDGKTYPIEGVQETSEGGLLGIALHSDFETNKYAYLYITTDENGILHNKVDQYALDNGQLTFQRNIVDDIPAASNHNGGGIAFGPDGKLYVTTGDAAEADSAQDKNSLAGKILRLNDDGSTPIDNPFNSLVWSYGHRNPQGIAWDDEGRMWSVEHGPSGERGEAAQDELNLIEKGANYGWPIITGDETREGMRTPIAQSGTNDTWAPAGLAYYDGSLYFAGLRGQSLYESKIKSGTSVELVRHFSDEYGRLRAVTAYKNSLYVSTSNRDGRGSPNENDDKILRINPAELQK